jgi:biotin carboxylase
MANLVMVMPYRAYLIGARQEGFRVCAIWDPSLSSVMPTSPRDFPAYLTELRGLADDFVLTDFSDRAGFRRVVRQAVAGFSADYVYHVGQEASMLQTYRLAEDLGKAVNPSRSIELLNDKLAMRQMLADMGVSAVRFEHAPLRRDVRAALSRFRLPVVVKPTGLAGSRGVFLVRRGGDLVRWERLLERYHYHGPFLVEEYLPGPEFSVETISSRGRHDVVGVTRNFLGPAPLFVENGHVHPAPDPAVNAEVAALAVELLRLAGYLTGPAHTEIIWTQSGPRIVESQARLAGGRIPHLVKLATGLDMERAVFRALAGRPLGTTSPGCSARVAFLEFPRGRLRSVTGLDAVRELDFVRELSFPFEIGDVIPPVLDAKSRHGYVVVTGSSPRHTQALAEQARSMISTVVDPADDRAGRLAAVAGGR